MTLKITGAIMIVVVANYFGCSFSTIYKHRIRCLEELLLSLELFKTEINYGRPLLPEIFRSIAERLHGPAGSLFRQAGEYMGLKKGLSAGECWCKSLRDRQGEMDLDRDQLDLLEKIGLIWGRGDKQDQVKQANLMQELLRQALKKAREDQGKKEKLWRYLGLLGGFTLVILLL